MAIMAIIVSITFIIFGTPLALRMVGQNKWYGVRTAYTLGDIEAWYKVNSAGGKALIVAGFVSLFVIYVFASLWVGSFDQGRVLSMLIPLGMLSVVLAFSLTLK